MALLRCLTTQVKQMKNNPSKNMCNWIGRIHDHHFKSFSMNLLKNLTHNHREIQKNPPPLCYAEPKDANKDMTRWIGWIEGPQETPYAGGKFHLTIHFPIDFPFRPPEMQFITPIYHPNISTKGEICLDILHSQWSPVITIRSLLISVCSLLSDANTDHGLNKDALQAYKTNQKKYDETAREWTRKFAIENKTEK